MTRTRHPVAPWLCLVACALLAAGEAANDPTVAAEAGEPARQELPHIRVDLENRLVELEATVIARDVEWLELLACSPNSREHESLLTVPARPSHVHLALVMLGLEPGKPLTWRREGDQIIAEPAVGPKVQVTVAIRGDDGREVEVPAGDWIVNQQTGQPLGESLWMFTGSKFVKLEEAEVYQADIEGSVISLVNFGDEVLARPTHQTNMNDEAMWGARPDVIPPIGTAVKIRLRPLADDGQAEQPGDMQNRQEQVR